MQSTSTNRKCRFYRRIAKSGQKIWSGSCGLKEYSAVSFCVNVCMASVKVFWPLSTRPLKHLPVQQCDTHNQWLILYELIKSHWMFGILLQFLWWFCATIRTNVLKLIHAVHYYIIKQGLCIVGKWWSVYWRYVWFIKIWVEYKFSQILQ